MIRTVHATTALSVEALLRKPESCEQCNWELTDDEPDLDFGITDQEEKLCFAAVAFFVLALIMFAIDLS